MPVYMYQGRSARGQRQTVPANLSLQCAARPGKVRMPDAAGSVETEQPRFSLEQGRLSKPDGLAVLGPLRRQQLTETRTAVERAQVPRALVRKKGLRGFIEREKAVVIPSSHYFFL